MALLTAVLLAAVLANESAEIRFADAESGFGVRGICKTGAFAFVAGASEGPDFWELVFSAGPSTNDSVTVDNRTAAHRVVSCEGHERVFRWERIDLPGEPAAVDVEARVVLDQKSGKSRWGIKVENRSTRYGLKYVRYPYLCAIAEPGKADLLMPSKNAGARICRAYDSERNARPTFYSPGYYPMMFAYMTGGKGLYVSAEDGECRAKRLVFGKRNSAYFETETENSGFSGKASSGPRYEVTVTPFSGDWWQAARLYREWALQCEWSKKGTIAARKDFPRSLSDAHVWLLDGGEAKSVTGRVTKVLADHPNLKLAMEWIYWNHMPWDTDYPEFFPSRAGVPEGMSALKDRGVFVMPYTNGRLWQTDLAGFRYAQKDATKDADGNFWLDHYAGGAFAVMCPCAKDWQEVLRNNSRRVVQELHAGGVYLDQIAASASRPCFAAGHGHPLGGGNHWWKGYRQVLSKIHEDYSAVGAAITSEGTGDSWLDVIDGYLIATEATGGDVPFFPFVYSGRAVYFGSRLPQTESRDAQFFVHARALLGGIVPGWVHLTQCRTDEGRTKLEDLFRLGEARQAAADYFAYGTLEDELRISDVQEKIVFTWGKKARAESAPLIGSVWKNADGKRRAIAVVNVTGDRRTVKFRLPEGFGRMSARRLPFNEGTEFSLAHGVGRLSVAPREVALIEEVL